MLLAYTEGLQFDEASVSSDAFSHQDRVSVIALLPGLGYFGGVLWRGNPVQEPSTGWVCCLCHGHSRLESACGENGNAGSKPRMQEPHGPSSACWVRATC